MIWRRGNNGERRGEKFFARATNDAGQKQTGGYAPPMADVRAKNFFARATNDAGQKQTSGYATPMADIRAKNISPVPQMMRGRNRLAVTQHQWLTSGRKIFRPYKWMIGDAKRFAFILMIGSGWGGELAAG